jgi:hypothetical protein
MFSTCEEQSKLLSAYRRAVSHYYTAVEAMEAASETVSKEEYHRMRGYVEQSRAISEQARINWTSTCPSTGVWRPSSLARDEIASQQPFRLIRQAPATGSVVLRDILITAVSSLPPLPSWNHDLTNSGPSERRYVKLAYVGTGVEVG